MWVGVLLWSIPKLQRCATLFDLQNFKMFYKLYYVKLQNRKDIKLNNPARLDRYSLKGTTLRVHCRESVDVKYRPVPKLGTAFGGGTTSHGHRRKSAVKLSTPLQKEEYLTSALHGTSLSKGCT